MAACRTIPGARDLYSINRKSVSWGPETRKKNLLRAGGMQMAEYGPED